MKTSIRMGWMALAVFLCGCATVTEYRQERAPLMNPQRINETGKAANATARAYAAQEVMVNNYYASMRQAQPDYSVVPAVQPRPRAVFDYVNEGIALNTAYCRRWFHRIDDTARQFDLNSRDMNVITALGTTALGLLEASAKTVSIYGAATTAVAGFGDNFNSALLTAPSAKNVENKVMAMLAAYGNQLRVEAQNMSFAEAYTRLETHADLCTFTSIRDVVNTSLASTVTEVSRSGTITTAPPVAPAPVTASYQRDDSGERITAWWLPGGAVDVAHEQQLVDWLGKHGIFASVPFVAHAKVYEAARKQMVTDLALPPAPQ